MMYVHRCIGVALATLGVMLGGLALSSGSALAAGPYKFLQALPAPTAPFSQPWGLAVGPSGEVFVANLGSNVVDVYNSNDEFQAEFAVAGATNVYQLAVDDSATSPSKGDVYVANLGGNVHKYTYDALTK